ncbi:hypothetical protein [Lamprobacter modestohalophilus]|nr:hypothetical protein [Lamprobacter modestohalophilus]
MADPHFQLAQRIQHPKCGEGVVARLATDGPVRVFLASGERQVFAATLRPALSVSADPVTLLKPRRGQEEHTMPRCPEERRASALG